MSICVALVVYSWLGVLSPNGLRAGTGLPTEQNRVDQPEHWSFLPRARPSLPRVKLTSWPRASIDRFVLSRLERDHVTPAPEADRRTLIRRVSLDLTGLPLAPSEVEAIVADDRPDAYERLVDRLLASPHYGERMALDWLDSARYADTYGYHEDWPRQMWAWRDWVITAFNNNQPFDQFTIEQLAGDLLPNPTQDQLVATGFNRLHGLTASGHPDEFRARWVADRVTTTSAVWLALTTGCSQCHDHKYDPISQVEFYRLYAYFNTGRDRPTMDNNEGNVPPLVSFPSPGQEAQRASLATEISSAEKELQAHATQVGAPTAQWQQEMLAMLKKQSVREGIIAYDPSGATAKFDSSDKFSFSLWIRPKSADGTLISRIDDRQAGRGYDVLLQRGTIVVHLIHRWPDNAIQVLDRNHRSITLDQWVHVCVTYDGSSNADGVKLFVNGEPRTLEITHSNLDGTIKTDQPLSIGGQDSDGLFDGLIDDLQIYGRPLSETDISTLANPGARIMAIPPDQRNKDEQDRLRKYYLENHDSRYKTIVDRLSGLRKEQAALRKSIPTTMVMGEMERPRRTFVFKRGLWNRPGEEVTAGTPAFLPPPPGDAPPNRLGFARWLVEPTHPLTSRVIVNRFWQRFFGTGIVATTEDFGTQGEPPSSLELLDFLASEFVESGWDVKGLIRSIVTSATYRQDSRWRTDFEDPENRLLARGPRFRLSAETLRDNALAASGLLVSTLGGPSVRPYQPEGLWMEATNRPYQQDHGDKLYRRSLYTYWRRTVPPPSMVALDAPSREICTVRRQRSNTPLGALVTMNDPTFVEAARALAQRTMHEAGPAIVDRANFAFQLATLRRPDSAEQAVLLDVYHRQLAVFRNDTQSANDLLSVGESVRNAELDPAEHAAWTTVAALILNLDETLTKE
ncbi:MAG: DUF1553 domain-containing protein [Mariniblastus sp.]|nr:DUF1553 domain-containing protein [Mariniblastus sp.]